MVANAMGEEPSLQSVLSQFSPTKRKRLGAMNEDVTPEERAETIPGSANTRAPVKRPKYPRYRKQSTVSSGCDSGICVDESPCSSPADTDCASPALRNSWSSPGLTTQLDLQIFREYGEKCYDLKRESEKKFHPRNCLARQPQVTAEDRCKLVSWLIPVHRYFNFSFESMCLTVNIMDRFLQTTPVASDCFQLVGITSLLLACKQVEVYPPRIKQLLALCCDAFTREQLRNLECIILIKLNFELATPSLDFFLEYFTNTSVEHQQPHSRAASIGRLARRLAELSFADYSFNGYPPSLLAISALSLADRMLHPEECIDLQLSDYPPCMLEDCVERLKLLVALNEESLASLQAFEPTDRSSALNYEMFRNSLHCSHTYTPFPSLEHYINVS
ncbi:LOW QUALITY PROTEIN: cyclin-O [Heptranchias perlo]|uniref:LOW QUALITY PROTEIN: cyclin-O n=1 Tax=Heptranchias perlo TaxID=212740 RepID=UPI0035597825